MKLSASALKTFTKCGHKFKLEKLEGIEEPGQKSFGMLYGNIMHDTVSACSTYLNTNKKIEPHVIGDAFLLAYEKRLTECGTPLDTLPYAQELIKDGLSMDRMVQLYVTSESINSGPYRLKIPAPTKTKPLPENKSTPTLGMILVKGIEDLNWFFFQNNYADLIRDAAIVEHERYFEYRLTEEEIARYSMGFKFDEEIILTGYFDQSLVMPNGEPHTTEFKTDKTTYQHDFVQRMVQLLTYRIAEPMGRTHLFDISHQRDFTPLFTEAMVELTIKRYIDMAKATTCDIYIPACGTDPYNDGKILCGHKCGTCPFASGALEMEEAA